MRAFLAAGALGLLALAVGRAPLPGAVRAAGMFALPCALLPLLRAGVRRLADAANRMRAVRQQAPAAPARRRR